MKENSSKLFLHGALGAAIQFEKLKNMYQDEQLPLLLDFIGHGQNEKLTGNLNVEWLSEQLVTFIEKQGISRPNIFGYSLGGYVAVYTASRFPDLIGKIVTLGTKFAWSPQVVNQQFGFLDSEKIKAEMPAFATGLKELHGDKWEILTQQTFGLVHSLGNHPLIDAPCLSKIQIPVFIMRGEKDKMVSEEESIDTADQILLGKYICLPNTPHPLEKVDLQMLYEKIQELFHH
ncbi:MAG: alpha/beta hydrolase [Saprospiraceae bacterium]|nr:alpha/beta hydrolase [Saprospiraceae bacterium]